MRGLRFAPAVLAVVLVLGWSGLAPASSPVWARQSTPSPSRYGLFDGVSCPTATHCVAVGIQTLSDKATGALVESSTGNAWKVVKVPQPAGQSDADLAAVSCTSATACVAVGFTVATTPGAESRPFSEVLHGATWKIVTVPLLASFGGQLASVSCKASTCIAAGVYLQGGGSGPYAEVYNGTAWTLDKLPAPGGTISGLNGVSCASASICTAVGYQTSNAGRVSPLVERSDGATWKIVKVPGVASSVSTDLSAVSCPTTASCVAVGETLKGSKDTSLAERDKGSTWTVVTTPKPATAGGYQLDGVACTSASSCRAVGDDGLRPQLASTLAEAWSGKTWSIQTSADPSPSSLLNAVACTSGPVCRAAGGDSPTPTRTVTLVEHN